MTNHPLYLAYGILLLGLASIGGYRGWTFSRLDESRDYPRSVRDNPGASRSSYGGYSRYVGGK